MWFPRGGARRGVGLRLTRSCHRWVIMQTFRFSSFYCRSEHNVAAVYISRASEEELLSWGRTHSMVRIGPREAWAAFCLSSKIHPDAADSLIIEPCVSAAQVSANSEMGTIADR